MNCVFENEFADIPEHTKDGIRRYVEHHCQPGGFLTAVICGNLFEAVRRADLSNRRNIVLIALWFDRYFPGLCGADNLREWISNKEQA